MINHKNTREPPALHNTNFGFSHFAHDGFLIVAYLIWQIKKMHCSNENERKTITNAEFKKSS